LKNFKRLTLFISLFIIVIFFFISGKSSIVESPIAEKIEKEDTLIDAFELNVGVEERLNKFLADGVLENAHIGFEIRSLDNKIIVQHQAKKNFIPASTIKAFTTATTLALYPSDYKFVTPFFTNGKIKNDTLVGDLIIKASGDPTFLSKYIESNLKKNISEGLKSANIKFVKGNILLDVSIFSTTHVHDYWNWVDLGNYYGASFLPINFMDNAYSVYLNSPQTTNKKVEIIRTEPYIKDLNFINYLVSSDSISDMAYIYASPLSYNHLIRGTIPKNKNAFVVKGAMPEPHLRFGEWLKNEFSSIFKNSDIKVSDISLDNFQPIFEISSPNISDIIKETNHRSINIFAESCDFLNLQKLSNKYPLPLDTPHPNLKFWQSKGINTKTLQVQDGSGLSRTNFISPQVLNQVLIYSFNNEAFVNSLPISGESGTVRGFANVKAKGKIKAKSGFLNGVLSYCGYITSKSGEVYTFTIFVNNHGQKPKLVKARLSKFIDDIYAEL
jgi:serine-type D-Ala-D-Ala carboxypeptidase/endopeptidase (penicillin-binding protein 4)